ncbi:MAG: hypothetical protein QM811_06070 [Pirellulales bacterium]
MRFRVARLLLNGAKATVGLEPALKMLDGLRGKDTVATTAEPEAAVTPVAVAEPVAVQATPAAQENPTVTSAIDAEIAIKAVTAFWQGVADVWRASELRKSMKPDTK